MVGNVLDSNGVSSKPVSQIDYDRYNHRPVAIFDFNSVPLPNSDLSCARVNFI